MVFRYSGNVKSAPLSLRAGMTTASPARALCAGTVRGTVHERRPRWVRRRSTAVVVLRSGPTPAIRRAGSPAGRPRCASPCRVMRWSASPSHTGHRTAPSDIAFAGESAGGGLAIATLVNARDHGLPLPAAAFVMSPYADLTLAGTAMETKREVDPLMSREALQSRVTDYTAGQDAALGLVSPIFADLSGLPPLIIQAGTHEVLLDDAVRLARQAATADVQVTLDITPRVPHVFQAYHPILDEAAAALDRAGQLLSAHLAGAERVTGEQKAERKLSS